LETKEIGRDRTPRLLPASAKTSVSVRITGEHGGVVIVAIAALTKSSTYSGAGERIIAGGVGRTLTSATAASGGDGTGIAHSVAKAATLSISKPATTTRIVAIDGGIIIAGVAKAKGVANAGVFATTAKGVAKAGAFAATAKGVAKSVASTAIEAVAGSTTTSNGTSVIVTIAVNGYTSASFSSESATGAVELGCSGVQ